MYDVVALGELLIDFAEVSSDSDGYPTIAAHPGGAPANFLATVNKFGGKTALDVAKEAYEQGADYLGVGAIYPTTTKVKTVLTSVDTLRDICNAVSIPVCAIGGLNKENIDVLKGIPIAGICVVSAIMKADDPKLAAKELKAAAKELKLCK